MLFLDVGANVGLLLSPLRSRETLGAYALGSDTMTKCSGRCAHTREREEKKRERESGEGRMHGYTHYAQDV